MAFRDGEALLEFLETTGELYRQDEIDIRTLERLLYTKEKSREYVRDWHRFHRATDPLYREQAKARARKSYQKPEVRQRFLDRRRESRSDPLTWAKELGLARARRAANPEKSRTHSRKHIAKLRSDPVKWEEFRRRTNEANRARYARKIANGRS